MMCYRDMTFCSHHENCSKADTCHRAYTEEVRLEAVKWWGDEDVPVCFFREQPECHVGKTDCAADCGCKE